MSRRPIHLSLMVPALAAFAILLCSGVAQAAEHRVGLGVHYWQTVDDLIAGEDLEDDGVSFLLSYQYVPKRGLFRFEFDLEYFSDGFGGSADSAISPVVYVVVGKPFYVAGGLGVTFSSGLEDDPSDPFFTGRVGYLFDLLPGLALDVNANYRTNAFEQLGDFDVDTFTLGAIVRLKL